MPHTNPEPALRMAAEQFDAKAQPQAELTLTKSRLHMLAHFVFDATRITFLDEASSDVDRIFGVDTENEVFYDRAAARIERLSPAQTGQGIAALASARQMAAECRRLPRDQGRTKARNLIRAVDAVMERIYRLGPIDSDPNTAYVTRRPALL